MKRTFSPLRLQQGIQAKINELGLQQGSVYKQYGINEINVYTYRMHEDAYYQVKMEELFKYIEEKLGRLITIEITYETDFCKYYSVE